MGILCFVSFFFFHCKSGISLLKTVLGRRYQDKAVCECLKLVEGAQAAMML